MKIIKTLLISVIAVNLCYSANQKTDERLIRAALSGNTKTIQQLLNDKSIDINAKDRIGFTALMWGSHNGHKEIVELLLNHPKINVNIKNNQGNTALIWASFHGNKEIVELLLNHPKIDVNIRDKKNGRNALEVASLNGHKEIAELLQTYKNEYLPYRNNRIAELKKINEALPSTLTSMSFPKELVGIVQQYAVNDFMTFLQWLKLN